MLFKRRVLRVFSNDTLAVRRRGRRARSLLPLLAATAALAVFLPATSAPTAALTPDQVGEWGPILNWPTQGKHMILMPTGKVLMFPVGDKTYVWNPTTGEFKFVPATFGDIHCAGHVTVADGDPLVVGGVNVSPFIGIKLNARFDAQTETWTTLTPMKYARWYPTITALSDGRVLAISGTDENKAKATIPEVYDPATDTWTELAGASRTQPLYPFMYEAPDGRVLDAAPKGASQYLSLAGSGSWSSGPVRPWDNQSGGCCNESGAMYDVGKILQSGGGDPAHARTGTLDLSAATPAWEEVESMAFPRRRHNDVVLADGSVLAVGGTKASDDVSQAVLEAERWDPTTQQWDTMAAMAVPRMYHSSAILLPDGTVVAAGGDNPSSTAKLTAQIYKPPYLFKGPRPLITSSPSNATYGSTFAVGTDTAGVSRVALIRPGSATHAIDMNQRYVPLAFTQSGNDLNVTAPANGRVAPPGAYMLVVVNGNGVPSVASWITIAAGPPPPPPPPTPPTADFVASPTSGPAPLTVSFSNTTTGSGPMTFKWDFTSDGVVDSTGSNPQFTYTTPGSHTVTLVATNDQGMSTKTAEITVTEAPPPPPPGTTETYAPEADARVHEATPGTNYGTSYLRTDGGTDPDVETYLKFNVTNAPAGTESVKLRVYATSGTNDGPAVETAADDSWTETGINWSNRPARTATWTADKGAISVNTWAEFDVTSLVTGNGTHTLVLATDSTDGLNMNSREAADASLRPQLVVTPAMSGPPTASFTGTPLTGTRPLAVKFTNTSTGSKPMTLEWDFENDGVVDSTEENPTHTYTSADTYDVRLKVSNADGSDELLKPGYVVVSDPPEPGETLTFAPAADAYVKSDKPTGNTGNSTSLRVDARPEAITYIKVDVSGLSGAPASAKLRLYATDGSRGTASIFSVSNFLPDGSPWTETGITWNNRPDITGSALSTSGTVTLNTWIELDVGSAITGNGSFSFAIKGSSSDTAYFSSRQAASNKPELVITP